ncbi:MAG: DapH/DapD/GlmU-related protein [Gallionella sp.]|jgi:lipopolysaccharide O-acetyltransferase
MGNLSKRLAQISKVAAQERPHVALFRMVGWFAYIIEGKASAYLAGWKQAYLGRGSRVIGTRFIRMGEGVSIGRYAWIEAVTESGEDSFRPEIRFGKGFHASERLHISAINRINIGDNCLFGSCVYISDHNHGSYKGEEQSRPDESPVMRRLVSNGPVVIGANVWIGDNVTIVGPIRIGNGVVVGANSVVTCDVPDNVMIGGIPARIIKQFNFTSGRWEAIAKS